MPKQRPAFSEDLRAIQSEVENDVGVILDLAKQTKSSDASPSTSATEPVPTVARARRINRPSKTLSSDAPQQRSLLQNVTTRLSQRTNELLTEAALRQRLKKAIPATRQDIIEVAVSEWLKLHGYNRRSE